MIPHRLADNLVGLRSITDINMSNLNFKEPVYCVITGASRGIGRTIAIETARLAQNKLVLVLVARSEIDLNETKNLVLEVNENVIVHMVPLDLSKAQVNRYEELMKNTLIDLKDPFSAVIFHNAGHIGHIGNVLNLSDSKVWSDYFDLNVFSVMALNSVFVHHVMNLTKNITIVNITSLFGRQANSNFGMYGSGKAARDMYFKVLAKEEKSICVLNYSPGMVQTDMAKNLLTQLDVINRTQEKDKMLKQALKPEQTVQKMFSVLEEHLFESGDIVDYYD